jgi:hypothetical protein
LDKKPIWGKYKGKALEALVLSFTPGLFWVFIRFFYSVLFVAKCLVVVFLREFRGYDST